MRITFVYVDYPPAQAWHWNGYFHYGVASLSAALKAAGHQTALVHIPEPMERDAFVAAVEAHAPDLIAVSANTNSYEPSMQMLGWLRAAGMRAPAVVGGVHATLAPEEAIAANGVDYVCRGESEHALVELCDRLDAGRSVDDVGNIWLKRDGQTISNPVRPLIQDLDQLPHPDREIFDYGKLANERLGVATMNASRGCPYDCTYCCNHALRALYPHQRYMRFRSVDNVLSEIEAIRARYPFISAVHFDDDILFIRRAWFEEFTTEYKSRIGLPFSANLRPGPRNQEVIVALAEAGCRHLQIGLESGNDYVRQQVLNRAISADQIAEAVRIAHDHGMKVEVNSMVGLPGESAAAMLDTIKLNARIATDRPWVSIFYPYPMTRLHDVCVDKGYLTTRKTTSYFFDSVLDLDTATREQILMMKRYSAPMVRLYRLADRLPFRGLRSAASKALDWTFQRRIVANLAVAAFGPALWLRRRLTPKKRIVLSEFVEDAHLEEHAA